MKTKDLITVCLQNLFRHKARTFLTVLGVVIGCCSVIIMVSIGIGMKEAQEKALAEMGDLTIINVYPGGKGAKAAKINDKLIGEWKQMKEVEAATPKMTVQDVPVTFYAGADRRYKSTYITLVGLDPQAAQKLGYKTAEGSWDTKKAFQVLAGEQFAYMFEDTKRPEGRNMVDLYSSDMDDSGSAQQPKPFFNPMKTPVFMEMESGKDDDKKMQQKLEITGRLKEDYGKGMETSSGIVMRLPDLQRLMEEQSRLSGKKMNKNAGYGNAVVKVYKMEDVAVAEKEIQKNGFRTSSMESIRKPMEQEARQKQMMLGGLGAISLFVAALGITNTMIMSISERTREIGVMKSLGCFVTDVRKIFLLEAGCIGLMGGMAGTVVSYAISLLMNLASGGSRISVIPWWLAIFAVVFSIMIGVGAGFYPADKAVKIPALEAIKHD